MFGRARYHLQQCTTQCPDALLTGASACFSQMNEMLQNAIAAVIAEGQYSPVMDEPSPPPAPPAGLKRGRPGTREEGDRLMHFPCSHPTDCLTRWAALICAGWPVGLAVERSSSGPEVLRPGRAVRRPATDTTPTARRCVHGVLPPRWQVR